MALEIRHPSVRPERRRAAPESKGRVEDTGLMEAFRRLERTSTPRLAKSGEPLRLS
jgi:hypothetical protein